MGKVIKFKKRQTPAPPPEERELVLHEIKLLLRRLGLVAEGLDLDIPLAIIIKDCCKLMMENRPDDNMLQERYEAIYRLAEKERRNNNEG